ncbi:Proteasome assembly chaperone 1 [Lamellibrachia satsuma]|nr:Proteasome assembly chaperone 1 [Lamellibrachia satsuma]
MMATFFGEVLPVISRAVDDDDDDDEIYDTKITPVVRWSAEARQEMSESASHCLGCELLVIATGPAATAFAHVYVLGEQTTDLLAVVCSGSSTSHRNSLTQRAPTDRTCFVHRLREKRHVWLMQCNTEISAEQAFSFTDQLFSKVNTGGLQVTVLTTQPISGFRTETRHSDLEVPFLRALTTTHHEGRLPCPLLEQPTTVDGLPAQLLTYCQLHQIAAILYTCYTDINCPDIDSVRAFKKLLQSPPIKDIVTETSEADTQLRKLMTQHTKLNSLYI